NRKTTSPSSFKGNPSCGEERRGGGGSPRRQAGGPRPRSPDGPGMGTGREERSHRDVEKGGRDLWQGIGAAGGAKFAHSASTKSARWTTRTRGGCAASFRSGRRFCPGALRATAPAISAS